MYKWLSLIVPRFTPDKQNISHLFWVVCWVFLGQERLKPVLLEQIWGINSHFWYLPIFRVFFSVTYIKVCLLLKMVLIQAIFLRM